MSKWHVRQIQKGIYGELSKIQEELDEAVDAEEQEQILMLFYELSDIIGAVGGVAKKYGMTLEQIYKFSQLRTRIVEEEIAEKKLEENFDKTSEFAERVAREYAEKAEKNITPSRILQYHKTRNP